MGTSSYQLKLGANFSGFPSGIVDPSTLAIALFALVIFLTLAFTFIVAYHWLRYGHRSPLAIPALVLHVFVSFGLVLFAASGLP